MRAFTPSDAHEPNIGFHGKSHEPNERFYWLRSQTKQQLLTRDITWEVNSSCANYNNTPNTKTHK